MREREDLHFANKDLRLFRALKGTELATNYSLFVTHEVKDLLEKLPNQRILNNYLVDILLSQDQQQSFHIPELSLEVLFSTDTIFITYEPKRNKLCEF